MTQHVFDPVITDAVRRADEEENHPVTAPVSPAVPPTAATTPAWLIKLVALLVAVAGPVLAWVDPKGHISTPDAQAAIVLGFLIVAAAIFLAHVILAAVHEYGFSRIALEHVVSAEETEFKTVWPEISSTWQTAGPVLERLPDIAKVTADVAELQAKVDGIPAAQREAALAAIRSLVNVPTVTVSAGTAGTTVSAPGHVEGSPTP